METITHFVSIKLKNEALSNINITSRTWKSLTLGYPCSNPHKCDAYILDIRPGKYRFECWGSRGGASHNSQSGYGGYTSGKIVFHKSKRLYVYVGNPGYFNAMKNLENNHNYAYSGGATDVRLVSGAKWWDISSLISRIMVAAGGGGSEWHASVGGNAGGLEGGESVSATTNSGTETYRDHCPGAKQASGSECTPFQNNGKTYKPSSGEFGGSIDPTQSLDSKDYGGMGGGGYYGGTSYPYAFAGSGGSSFISGHDGCDAVENNIETIKHTHQSIHYSGLYFTHTEMIKGSEQMPLPNSNSKGTFFDSGYFRITLLDLVTSAEKVHHILYHVIITLTCSNSDCC